MGARASECQVLQEYTSQILKISCPRCHFVKFDVYFLGLSWEIFFGVITEKYMRTTKAACLNGLRSAKTLEEFTWLKEGFN